MGIKDAMDDVDKYLMDCVALEPMALEEEFIRLPADLAYWNNRYAEVYRYWLERKLITAKLSAERKGELRAEMLIDAKRVTISEVEDALTVDPGYQQAMAKQNAADAEKVRLHGVLDAIRTKRDMLISLGAHMRAEMQRDPLIRHSSRGPEAATWRGSSDD